MADGGKDRQKAVAGIVEILGEYVKENGPDPAGVADILETSGKVFLDKVSVKVTLTRCGEGVQS